MKFGRLIEYNIRDRLLEKSYTKCDRGTIPRPFSKISKLSVCLIYILKSYILLRAVEGYRKRLKLSCRPFSFTSYNFFFFLKKRGLELVSMPQILHDFWRKIFLLLYSIIARLPLLCEVLGNMCIVIVC